MRIMHRSIGGAAPALAAVFLLATLARGARAQVSVSGVAYAQYQYSLARDTLTADSAIQHINNFDITRAYINVIGRFDGGIGARITADIFTNGNVAGSRAYRIKYAYVTYRPGNSPLTFKLGEIQTPFLEWEEALWDYRMQGQMAMERGGYMSSSDFGAGVDGRWNADQFNFQAGIYNGENYSGALGDNRKDLMARASYRLRATVDSSRIGGLRLTGYAQLGAPSSGGQRNRFLGLLSYRTRDLTLAAEVATTKDSTTGGNTTVGGGAVAAKAQATGSVISAFGVYHFRATRISVIARVDIIDPNTSATGDKTTRVIGGVAYQIAPNCRLLANVDALSFESGFTPTAGNYATYVARQSAFFQAMFTF